MYKAKTTGLIGRFLKERSGNFAMITGLASIPVVMAVGLAVNYSQTLHLKSSMQTALDAALTSTAREISVGKRTPADARVLLERFLNTNGRAIYSVQGKYTLRDVTVDTTTRTVSATAFANARLAFDVFDLKDPEVGVAGAARYTDKQIEVAMMLDVTGSMGKTRTTNKIGDLQNAAKSAVNTMLKDQDPNNPRVRVALIPYAPSVNAGGLADILYVENGDQIPPRRDNVIFGGKQELLPFGEYVKIVGEAAPTWGKDGCATERKLPDGRADFSSDAPTAVRLKDGKEYYALINRARNIVGTCPSAKLVPLTADKDALLQSINDFSASGRTGGAIGIQWTQYMLSNKWQQVIKDRGLGDGPAAVNPRKVAKVAILMTDGQFNEAYADKNSSTVPNSDKESASRSNAEALCSNMRDKDKIEIYTIGFDLNNPLMKAAERDQAKKVLQNCASADTGSIKHYYEVSTGEELERAFLEIIANQERVALTN